MPERTMADGRIKLFWRDDRSQALEWGGFKSGEFIHVMCDDTPQDRHAARIKFDELKRQFKAEFKTDQRRKREMASLEDTAHLPEHSLRRLAALLLADDWKHYSDGRRKTLMRAVDRWEAWWAGDVNVNEIRMTHYPEFKSEVKRAWLADPTHYECPGENGLYQNLNAVHAVLKYAQKADVLQRQLIAGPKPPPLGKKRLVIDESVVAVINKYLARRVVRSQFPHHATIYQAIVLFEWHTACRTIEVLDLKWRDIDWEKGTMLFRDTKNGEDKRLPIFDELVPLLTRLKDLGLPRPFPCSENSYRAAWSQAVKDAFADNALLIDAELLHELTPHVLRHSAITNMANTPGMNELLLSTYSGHKDGKSLRQYFHANDETMRRIKAAKDGEVADSLRALQTV